MGPVSQIITVTDLLAGNGDRSTGRISSAATKHMVMNYLSQISKCRLLGGNKDVQPRRNIGNIIPFIYFLIGKVLRCAHMHKIRYCPIHWMKVAFTMVMIKPR